MGAPALAFLVVEQQLATRSDQWKRRIFLELPVLSDAIAHFVCDVYGRFPGGDHSIFTGLVRECGFIPGKRPLVYFRSAFGALDDRERELARAAVGWDVASLGGIASPTFTVEDG